MKNIAIVGGGACGSAAFIELVIQICSRNLQEDLSITLIERRDKFGHGMAFGTKEDSHLLNTQAELMGIYVKEPNDFSDWIKSRGGKDHPKIIGQSNTGSAYTSRNLYGEYVREQLEEYIRKAEEGNVSVELINDEATNIESKKSGELEINLKSSNKITADYILLAPGTPKPNKYKELKAFKGYIDFPWPSHRIISEIDKDEEVGVLGTSLSAIDTVLTLINNGHCGKITLFSPLGMLPRVQPPQNKEIERKHLTLENIHRLQRSKMRPPRVKELFRLFIKDVEDAEGEKLNWRSKDRSAGNVEEFLKYDIESAKRGGDSILNVTYSLRYDASVIWGGMSLKQKKLFKKWLGSHWTSTRHAMPLHNAEILLDLLQEGQLRVIPEIKIVDYSEEKQMFRIITENKEEFYMHKLVNATGTASKLKGMNNKLIANLVKKEYLKPYPAGGAVINPRTMQLVSKQGGNRMYAVGHILNGMLLDVDAMWFDVRTIGRCVEEIIFKAKS
ncbi:FAD/NAD(P)-binding protein [Salegentibacter sp. F188]|uniref:FAD/NAD(P)-binding protein n=1 Tax=Autumnicola patrickiae TaxID=3075591 RepID=A0ABU3DZU6_9FLAO|nr:FAD/NAD(P)-binding protein [Salegentibacter sp. F188]MDT0689238.1 FAD/NAD(P)-binding protein [Salegentibacter sp. F188]